MRGHHPLVLAGTLLAIGTAAAAAPLDGYALFALEELRASGLVVASGDVGVAAGRLSVSGRLDAPASRLTAPSVRLDGAARCAGILADHVRRAGDACPQAGPFTGPSAVAGVVAREAAPAPCDADAAVRVGRGGSATLHAGVHGAVVVGAGGVLRLAGGDYALCSLTVRRGGRVVFDAAASVSVSGRVLVGADGAVVPAAGVRSGEARIRSAGGRVRLGRRAVVTGDLLAPSARLTVEPGARLSGRFVARAVGAARATVAGHEDDANGDDTTTTTTTVPDGLPTTTSTTTPGTCGNGAIDAGEECDGEDLGGATCPNGSPDGALLDGSPGGAVVCAPDCRLDFSGCDGTTTTTTTVVPFPTTTAPQATTTTVCPPGQTTTTRPPTCGNGRIDPGEECDGDCLGGATCPDGSPAGAIVGGSPGGAVVCTPDCRLDFSGCGGVTTTTIGPFPTTTLPGTPTTTLPTGPTTTTVPGTPTSTVTSTSVAGVTTTTAPPAGATSLDFVTVRGTGSCGAARDAAGQTTRALACGGLDIGGGPSTVPEGPTPDGATSRFTASCSGDTCTLGATGASGAGFDCTAAGCFFGTPLPIPNFGTSTCVVNRHATAAGGTVNRATGVAALRVSLTSSVFLTGNHDQPCPRCSATGTPAAPGQGTCTGGATPGAACTSTNSAGLSRDCQPGGGPCAVGEACNDGSVRMGDIAVDLGTLTTGTASDTADANGTFCPGQPVQQPGCFGSRFCRSITEQGRPAGAMSVGAGSNVTLASVFCIPATSSLLLNAAAGLPGPGATTLVGVLRLNP